MEIIKDINYDMLFVTFSGRQQGLANMTTFEFRNFLEENFSNYDKIFCRDEKVQWYNFGITGLTKDINDTLDFLHQKISKYKKVIFIGSSMGGYAAILFGSILNVDTIIAFRPQTFLNKVLDNFDKNFEDVKPYINNTTQYYIYGDSNIIDPNDIHSIEYCRRISEFSNVYITEINDFDLKSYKDRGLLLRDFNQIIV